MLALGTRRTQTLTHGVDPVAEIGDGHAARGGLGLQRSRQVEDVAAVETALHVDAEELRREGAVVRSQRGENLIFAPEEERSLAPGAVGVGGRVEDTLGSGHVAQHMFQRLLRDAGVQRLARELEGEQVGAGELRLVVEHLLEMRHAPETVGRVAVKAAAHLVVHAAVRHGLQTPLGDGQRLGVPRAKRRLEQQQQLGLVGEFGGPVHVGRIAEQQLVHRRRDDVVADAPAATLRRRGALYRVRDLTCRIGERLALAAPHLIHALQQRGELLRREVRGAVEWLAVGSEKARHRPAAVADDEPHRRHVDRIDVWAQLPVDLDGDETLVQQSRNGLVVEALALHDVTPVTGGVTDGEEHRLALAPCFVEGVAAPRKPVDGIVGVLLQVRRVLQDEAVGVARSAVRTPVSRARLVVRPLGRQRTAHGRGHVRGQRPGAGQHIEADRLRGRRGRVRRRRQACERRCEQCQRGAAARAQRRSM